MQGVDCWLIHGDLKSFLRIRFSIIIWVYGRSTIVYNMNIIWVFHFHILQLYTTVISFQNISLHLSALLQPEAELWSEQLVSVKPCGFMAIVVCKLTFCYTVLSVFSVEYLFLSHSPGHRWGQLRMYSTWLNSPADLTRIPMHIWVSSWPFWRSLA